MNITESQKKINVVLEGLMNRYKERVPDVQKIINAMIRENLISNDNDIQNDHIAFRTMGVPLLGIQSLERVFLNYGYVKKEAYHFEKKKLDAYWYAPPSNEMPRIFISELRVKDLSQEAQNIITHYTSQVKKDPTLEIDLNNPYEIDAFLHSPLWSLPTYKDFKTLENESEYASWVIYNRYYLNHYTISVHVLPEPYNKLEKFNEFLETNGIKLNTSGGKIKTSPDGLLSQSSSVSKMIEATFLEGEKKEISGSYVEFAQRKILPQFSHLAPNEIKREHRREGFEAGNADKIFESTYSTQTKNN